MVMVLVWEMAVLSSLSTCSFPVIPECPGIHSRVGLESGSRYVCMCSMRCMIGCVGVEGMCESAVTADLQGVPKLMSSYIACNSMKIKGDKFMI